VSAFEKLLPRALDNRRRQIDPDTTFLMQLPFGRMDPNRLKHAVANNVDWCRAIARSHGIESHQGQDVWYCSEVMPPFYPNLVTLEPMTRVPREVDRLATMLPSGWGLKDSFASLELASYGFTLLLTAEWFVREPAAWTARTIVPPDAVQAANTESALSAWVDAWSETPPGSSIFEPQLLEEESVEFLFVVRDGKVRAGIATNLSDEVVGISNAFGEPRFLSACIRRCAELHPARAVVGYGSSAEMRGLRALGFCSLGALRIWLHG